MYFKLQTKIHTIIINLTKILRYAPTGASLVGVSQTSNYK